mmetsp:Transcript_29382/g.80302  ORF Transcript_29382/g.80302 Transcript_29382/m.80302 type:complete len:297 (+) Transcript_29382:388-1278(+)
MCVRESHFVLFLQLAGCAPMPGTISWLAHEDDRLASGSGLLAQKWPQRWALSNSQHVAVHEDCLFKWEQVEKGQHRSNVVTLVQQIDLRISSEGDHHIEAPIRFFIQPFRLTFGCHDRKGCRVGRVLERSAHHASSVNECVTESRRQIATLARWSFGSFPWEGLRKNRVSKRLEYCIVAIGVGSSAGSKCWIVAARVEGHLDRMWTVEVKTILDLAVQGHVDLQATWTMVEHVRSASFATAHFRNPLVFRPYPLMPADAIQQNSVHPSVVGDAANFTRRSRSVFPVIVGCLLPELN